MLVFAMLTCTLYLMIKETTLTMVEENNIWIMFMKAFHTRIHFQLDIQYDGIVNHKSRAHLKCHQIPKMEFSYVTI